MHIGIFAMLKFGTTKPYKKGKNNTKLRTQTSKNKDVFCLWDIRHQWVEMRLVPTLQSLCHFGRFFFTRWAGMTLLRIIGHWPRDARTVQGILGHHLCLLQILKGSSTFRKSISFVFIFVIMEMKKQASKWFRPSPWNLNACWLL